MCEKLLSLMAADVGILHTDEEIDVAERDGPVLVHINGHLFFSGPHTA